MMEDEKIVIGKFVLLKPPPDTCQVCAVDHAKEDPHDQTSLYYQMWFYEKHGRWPTWADAIAHCSEELQKAWEEELKLRGVWEK